MQSEEGEILTPKEKAIKKLIKEFEEESWLNINRFEIDFHNFIVQKIVPYVSIKGIKLLTKEYHGWNEQGKMK